MVLHASPHATTCGPLALPTTDRHCDKGKHVFFPEMADDWFGFAGLR